MSWTQTVSEKDLPELATRITRELSAFAAHSPEGKFCLWLQGGLGAGKTSLTGAMLRALGLASGQPVTSPTYTYMNEYKIAGQWYAHLDLYRAGPHFSPEDIGLTDAREYSGLFIEWPTQIPENPSLLPTHTLTIEHAEEGRKRTYAFAARD